MPKTKKTIALKKKITHKETKHDGVKPSQKRGSLQASVYDMHGKEDGVMTLPKMIFDGKINEQLLAQAVRVYLANQREGGAATKTRGMVEGSTRKIYRQKGTGKARHGGIRAPIFVGGGIAFGPHPKDFSLKFPKQMLRKALISAFSKQWANRAIMIVSDLSSLPQKTKQAQLLLSTLKTHGSTLVVFDEKSQSASVAFRNIHRVDTLPVSNVSTYHVLAHTTIVLTKESIPALEKRLLA